MKKSLWLFLAALVVAGMFGITGCTDHQERYEEPPWLGGSSIETLEKRGNYTSFLQLMEKANYTEPITKQLFTLFVPSDEAFEEYFASAGISSVDDLSEDEAVNLFTLHVLRNPRSRYYLIYEYVWNEFQGPKGEYASLFHRKRTPAESIPYTETVRYVPGWEGRELQIYTNPKNVPLFSAEWFNDFGGAEDGSDYLFMYPGSTWAEGYPEGMGGLNWHNAQVIPNPEIPDELEVRTASGFIYFLDRVVPPMPSIEEYLIANLDKYGLYYDLAQRFAAYGNSRTDELDNIEYRKSYDLIFDLADENGPSTNTSIPAQNMWSAFIPNDVLLQDYLDNTVLQYYDAIDSVPRVTLYYILQSQLSGSLALKSKLANGYFNAFGDPTDLGPDDLISGYMCSNGVVYETNQVLEPNVFKTVAGTLFFDKNYSTLLFVFNAASMLSSISNPDSDVTVFAATNEALEEYGIRYNSISDAIEFRSPLDGKWSNMNSTNLVIFAQDQVYRGLLTDLDGPGGYVEMTSQNYMQYGNNQAGMGENQVFDRPAVIEDIVENEYNGFLVKVDHPIESRMEMGQLLTCGPGNVGCLWSIPEFSEFALLLEDLKMLDTRYKDPVTKENIPRLKFLAGADYWTGFIPNNAAMAQARADGIIPVEFPSSSDGKDSLESFVSYHFVKEDVIFDDGQESGTFITNYSYIDTTTNETVFATVEIMNSPGDLTILDLSGNTVPVIPETANRLTRKGVMQEIGSVLNYME